MIFLPGLHTDLHRLVRVLNKRWELPDSVTVRKDRDPQGSRFSSVKLELCSHTFKAAFTSRMSDARLV